MLQQIKITNVALIDEVNINFEEQLNILSGETGAGKSIIIDSLNFLLGKRADKTLIRSGKETAKVTAVFFVDENKAYIKSFFEKLGVESENNIIVTRTMSINGKSTTTVNGEFVSATQLRELTSNLVDIHGQNEHQLLLKEANQLKIVDDFGGKNVLDAKNKYLQNYNLLLEVNKNIKNLGGSEFERARQIELLAHEIKEIEAANLNESEEEELRIKFKRMQNSEKIANSVTEALDALNGNSVVNNIILANKSLGAVSQYDEELQKLNERFNSIKLELDDAVSELNYIGNSLEFDQEQFEIMDDRLEEIKKLKRKYGGSIESALIYLSEAKEKLFNLENSAEQLMKLNKEKQQIILKLIDFGKVLTNERKQSFNSLSKLMVKELEDLGMKNAKFDAKFYSYYIESELEEKMMPNGLDEIEFMFSANLGEPVKPLSKIISGGEMSRFMLALKAITNKLGGVPTMIFDEIDTGISGAMAAAVAKKLAKISRNHQVLAVSHLPQITAMADSHYYIEKTTKENKTSTSIKLLKEAEEINEIARMLSGNVVSNTSLENAKDLKNKSNIYKKEL